MLLSVAYPKKGKCGIYILDVYGNYCELIVIDVYMNHSLIQVIILSVGDN